VVQAFPTQYRPYLPWRFAGIYLRKNPELVLSGKIPDFPDRFGSIEDARIFCRQFFDWYNKRHKHSGIGFLTPEQVHYGLTDEIVSRREDVLLAAFKENSRRFRGKVPCIARPPVKVWINPPSGSAETPAPEGSGQGCPDFSDRQSWMTNVLALHHQSCEALL
jgi:hypothetical protein